MTSGDPFGRAAGAFALAALCVACTSGPASLAANDAAQDHDVHKPRSTAESFDYAALDRLIGDARYVVVGEDSHRMPAVHSLVGQMFRHLAEEKGFRTFVFESYWGIEEVLDAFLASDRQAPDGRETHFLNAFASPAITQMLLWARGYNRLHPDDPVRFTGYHPDQPVTDAAALHAFAERAPQVAAALDSALTACNLSAGRYSSDVELLMAHGQRRLQKLPGYDAQPRAACLAGLQQADDAIAAAGNALERQTSRAAVREAALHIAGLRFFVEHSSPTADVVFAAMGAGKALIASGADLGTTYQRTDAMRMQIFETLQETRPHSGKTFLWMHNGHAARRSRDMDLVHNGQTARAVMLGTLLAERYRDALVTIGNIVPCKDCGEPAGSLEPAFAARFGDRVAVVDFDARESDGLPLHTAGLLFAQYHKPISAWLDHVVLAEQFDGVIYLPNAETLP